MENQTMRHTIRRAAAAGIAICGCLAPVAQADAVDDYLRAEMAARKIPGLAVAVVRGQRIEKLAAYGFADVENGAAASDASIFAIASLDKELTSAGVLKAEQLGKLKLDEPVSKYLELPFHGMTIRQLLSHTSGLPDSLAELDAGRRYTSYSTEQLLALVRGLHPRKAPGSGFVYSDDGMFLAQNVTERATGEPWWTFMRREVFEPAGMHSVVSMNPHTLIPNRVSPYTLDADGHLLRDTRLGMDYGPLYTDLGMTVGDFARWLIALDGKLPLTPQIVAAMSMPSLLTDGTPAAEVFSWTRYGLGLGIDDILGEHVVLHSGHSGVGFVKLTERGLGVVVFTNLANSAGSDPLGLALGVAGLLEGRVALGNLPAAPAPDAGLAAKLRSDYEQFAAGTPDPKRYTAAIRATVLTNAGDFSGRIHNLGMLQAFEFLREERLDGERALWFRARYANATFYVRVSISSEGIITRLGWWHL
jgi:CubicO group peptidase (beta-lactamase class C family)